MREIILAPWGGLCNRMSAILSAIETQHVSGLKIQIMWDNVHLCKCDYDDLFYPLDMSSLNKDGVFYEEMNIQPISEFYMHPDRRLFYMIPDFLRRFVYDKCYDGFELVEKDFKTMMESYDKIYIRACAPLSPYQLDAKVKVANIFKPKEDIIKKIQTVTEQFGQDIVGIHIRRTDHKGSIEGSPMEAFYFMMDEEIERDVNVKFYVASDDEECKQQMRERYGNRVVTAEWNLSRDSVEGMKDAVAELYCLGSTRKIIGSARSTYSNMAARLNAIEVVKAVKGNK